MDKHLTKGCERGKPSVPLWPKQPGPQLPLAVLETQPCPAQPLVYTAATSHKARPLPRATVLTSSPALPTATFPPPLCGDDGTAPPPAWLSARGLHRAHPVGKAGAQSLPGQRDLRRGVRSPGEGPLPIYRPHSWESRTAPQGEPPGSSHVCTQVCTHATQTCVQGTRTRTCSRT